MAPGRDPAVRRLRVLYAAVGGGIGTLLPYLILYLTSRGLSPTEAGLVIGMMSAVGVLAIPLWGRLADEVIGVVPALRLSLALAVVAALALLAAGGSGAALVVCCALLAATRAPGEALSDTLTVGTPLGSTHYGQIRLWASVGFAVTVGLWGVVLRYTDLSVILLAYSAALLVAILSTRGFTSPRPAAAAGAAGARPSAPTRRPSRALVTLLVGVLVFGVAMGTGFTVLPLRIIDVGGTVTLVGAGMVVGAAAEVPLMHQSSWLARRFGPRTMVLLGGAVFAGSLVLYGALGSPLALVLVSALRGAGYGLVYVGFVTSIGALLPAEQQARGQAWLQTALLGVAPIAGASLGGLGYTHLSPVTLFSAAGVLALAGVLVACRGMTTASVPAATTRSRL